MRESKTWTVISITREVSQKNSDYRNNGADPQRRRISRINVNVVARRGVNFPARFATCAVIGRRILTASDGDGTTGITRSLAAVGAACAVWWASSLSPSCISPCLPVSISPVLAVVRVAGWRDNRGQCDSWSEKDWSHSSPISRWLVRGCCSQDSQVR